MHFRPLGDRVLVQRLEEEEKTASGIYIPDVAREKMNRGRVLAVGSGRLEESGVRIPLELEVGDVILFGKYSGSEVKVDGESAIIMREDEILGVIEDEQ
jgi:chaperonin GroES